MWLLAEDGTGDDTKSIIVNKNSSNGNGNGSDSDDTFSTTNSGMVPSPSATGSAPCGPRDTRADASMAAEGSSPRAIAHTGVVACRGQAAEPEGEPPQDGCKRAAGRFSSSTADMFRARLDHRLDGISILPSGRKRNISSEGRGAEVSSGRFPSPAPVSDFATARASATKSRQEAELTSAAAAADGGTDRDAHVVASRSAGIRTSVAAAGDGPAAAVVSAAEGVVGESRTASAACGDSSIRIRAQNNHSRWEWEEVTVDWKLKVG